MDYTVPKGIMYPVVGAFRALVCERDGQYDWTISPFNVWDEKRSRLSHRFWKVRHNLGIVLINLESQHYYGIHYII